MKKRTIVVTVIILLTAAAILAFAMSCRAAPASHLAVKPEIRFSSEYFNPDEERLTIYLPTVDMPQVLSWRVEILEPYPSYILFHDWVGRGQPPTHIVWDGINYGGECVHSASDYPIVYYTSDIFGNIKTIESKIPVYY